MSDKQRTFKLPIEQYKQALKQRTVKLTIEQYKQALKDSSPLDDPKDMRTCEVVCPICGTEQSLQEFIDILGDEEDTLDTWGFSCIGRLNEKKKGCDWSLGGLFQLHTVEVVDQAGEVHQRMAPKGLDFSKYPDA